MWILFIIVSLALFCFAVFRRRKRLVEAKAKLRLLEEHYETLAAAVKELADKASVGQPQEEYDVAWSVIDDVHAAYDAYWAKQPQDQDVDSLLQTFIRHGRWNDSSTVWLVLERLALDEQASFAEKFHREPRILRLSAGQGLRPEALG